MKRTWSEKIKELATTTFYGSVSGAAKGAAVGGSGVGIATQLLTFNPLVSWQGTKAGALIGAGAGGVLGGYDGFLRKYEESGPPIIGPFGKPHRSHSKLML